MADGDNETEKGWFAERVLKAREKNELVGAIVYGTQRIGKSSFCLQELHDIYGNWEDTLKYTLYDITDILRLLDECLAGREVIAFTVDDAGVHLSRYQWYINHQKVMILQQLLDTIGINVAGVLFNAPKITSIIKPIRDYNFYRIHIVRANSRWGRLARVHRKEDWMPHEPGREIARMYFNVKLPNEPYEKYKQFRLSFLKDIRERARKLVDKIPRASIFEKEIEAAITSAVHEDQLQEDKPEGDDVVPAMAQDGAP